MYAAQNNAFFSKIAKNLNMNLGFEQLTDTKFMEQYIVNTFQFSSAKNATEMKQLQQLIFDDKGKKKSFLDFERDAKQELSGTQRNWFRTEYDLASVGSVAIENWNEIYKDRDLFPYMIYQTRGDSRVRPEHAILNGLKFRIDDPIAQNIFNPNGWNCRCRVISSDDPKGVKTSQEAESYLTGKAKLDNGKIVDIVNPMFRTNVAINGIFPKDHTYMQQFPNANNGNAKTYNAPSQKDVKKKTRYSEFAKRWQAGDMNEIIFQNHDYFLNVRLAQEKARIIAKRNNGYENIRITIQEPDEIWGKWTNPEIQKDTLLTYIKDRYIIETKNGWIENAYYLQHNDSIETRRTGVLFKK